MTITIPHSTQPALHLCFIVLTIAFFSVSSISHAAITQTLGSGSAVTTTSATANFESTSALNGNPYTENGLSFSRTGLSFNNNSCGYAGCAGSFPATFSGNYMYGVSTGGYFTISSGSSTMYGLEMTIGNGWGASSTSYIGWAAYLNGTQVGSGVLTTTSGQIIGFSSNTGFNELRYTNASTALANYAASSTSYNAPAFDNVRAQFSNKIDFAYTGAAQTWTVPQCVTSINLTVAGAKGGGVDGGTGAIISAPVNVTPGQVLNIYVGGQGSNGNTSGGFNGGGTGFASTDGNAAYHSYGGGGASDIRIGGSALTNRVIVAGGGGGRGGGSDQVCGGNAACTDGVAGCSTYGTGGSGGTQTAGGAGGIPYNGTPPGGSTGALGGGRKRRFMDDRLWRRGRRRLLWRGRRR